MHLTDGTEKRMMMTLKLRAVQRGVLEQPRASWLAMCTSTLSQKLRNRCVAAY